MIEHMLAVSNRTVCHMAFRVFDCLQSPAVPKYLASVCNDLIVEDKKVCQAFTWDNPAKRAYFKGQPVNAKYGLEALKSNFTVCNHPNATTWILNAGLIQPPHVGTELHACMHYLTTCKLVDEKAARRQLALHATSHMRRSYGRPALLLQNAYIFVPHAVSEALHCSTNSKATTILSSTA